MMKVAILLLLTTTVMGTDQKPRSLQEQLDGELRGRTLVTKVVLRNMLADGQRAGMWSYVITDVRQGGQVVYGVASMFMIDQGHAIPRSPTCGRSPSDSWAGRAPQGTLCWVDIGKSVTVTSIQLSGDHLTIRYWPPGSTPDYTAPSAWVNFILGKDWQKTMTVDEVMEVVADGFVIERIERSRTLARTYMDLKNQEKLAMPLPSDPAEKHLEAIQRLRDILTQLIANRTEYVGSGKESVAQEISGYGARIRDLDTKASLLREEVRSAGIDRVLGDLAASDAEVQGFRATLSVAPNNQDELKRAEDLLVRWETNLQSRLKFTQALAALDANLASKHSAGVEGERLEIVDRRADLAKLAPKIELANLNSVYARLKAGEGRLMAAYLAAIETSKQTAATTEFRNHVKSMIDNREAAAKLGEAAAGEIQRLRRLMAGIR